MRGEHFVLAVGLGLVVLGAYQLFQQRPYELAIIFGVALVAFGLFRYQLRHLKIGAAGLEMDAADVARQLAEPTQSSDLKLAISTGIPMGWAETLMGTDHIVQVTAVNTGSRPLGVNSLGLSLSDGRYIPAIEMMPTDGNTRLPAILKPQETATTWLAYDPLRNALRREGARIQAVKATLADGSVRKEEVPDDWKGLGDPEKD